MNQVEIKRKQIQFFSYCLAGINVWVFGKQLGNNGLAYLAAAFFVFLFFWILTGKNVPDRLGRLLRSRNAKGQYKNVSKMRRNMMIFQIAAGLVGAVLCSALGYFVLEKAFRIPYGSMILWILSFRDISCTDTRMLHPYFQRSLLNPFMTLQAFTNVELF